MTSTTRSFALLGVSTVPVTVEVDLLRRLPSVAIVGMPAVAVREAADRVRSAMLACGMDFPRQRVVVSLSPADLRKDGTGFDLSIAAAIMIAADRMKPLPDDYVLYGELTLGGEVRPVRGAAVFAKDHPDLTLVCSVEMAQQVVEMGGRAIGIRTLGQLMDLPPLTQKESRVNPCREYGPSTTLDFKDVKGLPASVTDALVEAAVNRTPILFVGSPGCGKTMLAARLPGLLPPMTENEVREVTAIQAAAGLHHEFSVTSTRPFRAPHHSISPAGMIGGALLRPGECCLAHHGVLFLDEVSEFPRQVMEVLPSKHKDKEIVLNRVGGRITFPTDYWLVMAANPCSCGNFGHPTRPCVCSGEMKERYQARIDSALPKGTKIIHLDPIPAAVLLGDTQGPTTEDLRLRVGVLRQLQAEVQIGTSPA